MDFEKKKWFFFHFRFPEAIIGEFTPERYHPICVAPKNSSFTDGGGGGGNHSFLLNMVSLAEFNITPHYLGSSGIVMPSSSDAVAAAAAASASVFKKVWNPSTVPIILAVPLLLLSSFRNPTVFSKLTFLGACHYGTTTTAYWCNTPPLTPLHLLLFHAIT